MGPKDDKADRDNRSNQLNPNNDAYWNSRLGNDQDDDDILSYDPEAGTPDDFD
ncbi:MAG: hypothetical protein RLW87_20605 [Alphaproteobacteria bacterium]